MDLNYSKIMLPRKVLGSASSSPLTLALALAFALASQLRRCIWRRRRFGFSQVYECAYVPVYACPCVCVCVCTYLNLQLSMLQRQSPFCKPLRALHIICWLELIIIVIIVIRCPHTLTPRHSLSQKHTYIYTHTHVCVHTLLATPT